MDIRFAHIVLLTGFVAAAYVAVFSKDVLAVSEDYIRSSDPVLQQGRVLWLENCEGCHGYGVADAPIPMRASDWKLRVTKGKEVLYLHAIEGYIGEDYSMMPARGGNDELDDEQVRAAVDYMMFLAKYYINQQVKKRGDL